MSDDRFSEAVVHRHEDGTASIEWWRRSPSAQVLMSEELFIECVEKHNEVVRLRSRCEAAEAEAARLLDLWETEIDTAEALRVRAGIADRLAEALRGLYNMRAVSGVISEYFDDNPHLLAVLAAASGVSEQAETGPQ